MENKYEKKRLSRTNRRQFEELLNFVSSHPCLLRGKNKPREAQAVDKLWEQFANEINKKNIGACKTSQQWKKIFGEWKVNTKRKSREITIAQTSTGGGPSIKKPLNDLEEKLLSLTSSIHLGEQTLPDSLGGATMEEDTTQSVVECWYEEANCEQNVVQVDEAANIDSAEVEKINIENTPQKSAQKEKIEKIPKETKQSKVSNRYTTELIKEVCEQFAKAQSIKLESVTRSETWLENLTVCLNGIGNSLEEMSRAQVLNAEANMIRARAEEMNAQVQFLKFIKETEGS